MLEKKETSQVKMTNIFSKMTTGISIINGYRPLTFTDIR